MGTDGLLTSVPVFREDRDPGWEHVRMTRGDRHPVMLLYGISLFSAPILSSRSAPIRDLALALSKERRCRIGVRHDGKGSNTTKMGTDGILTSVPVFRVAPKAALSSVFLSAYC